MHPCDSPVCVLVSWDAISREKLCPILLALRAYPFQLCPRKGHFALSNKRVPPARLLTSVGSPLQKVLLLSLLSSTHWSLQSSPSVLCLFHQHSLPSSLLEFCTPPSATPHPFPLHWPSSCLTDLSLWVSTTIDGCLSFHGARVRMCVCACVWGGD